jgi:hypothetical protein
MAFALSAALPAIGSLLVGAGLVAAAITTQQPVLRVLAGVGAAVFFAICLHALGTAAYLMNTPRVAYRDGRVLVYLRPARPESLPVEAVECFFLGREPIEFGSRPSRVSNIVVRVAEAQRELRSRTDATRFGEWRDGYIILSGVWCEPITPDLMKRINGRLAEVLREGKARREATA